MLAAAAFDALTGVVDEIFPIEAADVERAKGIVYGTACRPATRSTWP